MHEDAYGREAVRFVLSSPLLLLYHYHLALEPDIVFRSTHGGQRLDHSHCLADVGALQ